MPEWSHQGCLATTRRAANRLLEVDYQHPDCDRMLAAFSLALPEVGRPDRNGCLLPMADDVADVWFAQACASVPDILSELRYLA
jgi:hypothetical protein